MNSQLKLQTELNIGCLQDQQPQKIKLRLHKNMLKYGFELFPGKSQ